MNILRNSTIFVPSLIAATAFALVLLLILGEVRTTPPVGEEPAVPVVVDETDMSTTTITSPDPRQVDGDATLKYAGTMHKRESYKVHLDVELREDALFNGVDFAKINVVASSNGLSIESDVFPNDSGDGSTIIRNGRTQPVSVYPVMKARLIARDFRHSEEADLESWLQKTIDIRGTTTWVWDITPRNATESGTYVIRVELMANETVVYSAFGNVEVFDGQGFVQSLTVTPVASPTPTPTPTITVIIDQPGTATATRNTATPSATASATVIDADIEQSTPVPSQVPVLATVGPSPTEIPTVTPTTTPNEPPTLLVLEFDDRTVTSSEDLDRSVNSDEQIRVRLRAQDVDGNLSHIVLVDDAGRDITQKACSDRQGSQCTVILKVDAPSRTGEVLLFNAVAFDVHGVTSLPIEMRLTVKQRRSGGGGGGSDSQPRSNQAPAAFDDVFLIDEDVTLIGNVMVGNSNSADFDPDGNAITVLDMNGSGGNVGTLITLASGAKLTINSDGSFTYSPLQDFNGDDGFTYRIGDGSLNSNAATVTITVAPVNDPPTFTLSHDVAEVEDFIGPRTVTVTADPMPADEAGQVVTYTLSPSSVNFASVSINPSTGDVSIDSVTDGFGSQLFTVTADDGQSVNNTSLATLAITIGALNDPPTFTLSGDVTEDEDFIGTRTVMVTADPVPVDEAGQAVTYTLSPSSVSFASVSINPNTGEVSIDSVTDGFGSQLFTVTADDGQSVNNTIMRSFTLMVTEVPSPALPAGFLAGKDTATSVLVSWQDVTGETSYELEWGKGNLNNSLTLPADSTSHIFTGLDTGSSYHFTIRACNGSACSAWHPTIGWTPLGQVDLSITMSDSVDPVMIGNSLTYTVTVDNAGPSAAISVVVTIALPDDVTFVSTSGCNEDPGGVPTCRLGNITSVGSAQFTLTVDVDPTATNTLVNLVTVDSDSSEPNTANNSASENTNIAQVDLSITMSASVDPVVNGSSLTYTVTVDNAGPSDAINVVVTIALPDDVTFVSTSGCNEDPGGEPTCSFGNIASGGSAQFTLNVDVDPTATSTLVNLVTVDSDTNEPDTTNNSATENTEIGIAVITTDDELNTDGDCSLREAIQAANTDTAVDACPAGSGADIIILSAGTYALSIAGASEDANATGDLDITSDVTINGVNAVTTIIDGGAIDRVFHVLPSSTLEITSVTIQNGSSSGGGGGILNHTGSLTLIDSAVSDNTAAFDGGGIFNNAGPLILTRSTVSGNTGSVGVGGGIYNTADVTITNSTISGNSADSASGGGIYNDGDGTVTLTDSTVSGNLSAGAVAGIHAKSGSLSGFVTLKNSIVSNGAGPDCGGGGTFTSLGHNLSSDSTCNLVGTGDLPSTTPLLGPLQNNGGPTETQALLTSSPAIDAGGFTCSATDQRGVSRPQGTNCDIGAFEYD